ncbi:MAG: U32 family peptidase [Tenericutes bacterium]|jgi:putative protease|nr:U32 family peptidase [Mycoplasmatota bacterium]
MLTELLAPAGNLYKAKIALLYGADAVYIGGKQFSLRARASNFDYSMIEELVKFAHDLNKKVYVTMNMVFHDEDVFGLDEYLLELEKIGVDAIICSNMIVIEKAKALTNLEIHLSTQFSLTNSVLSNYFYKQGVKRVVLSREASLDEIKMIQSKSQTDLEVFIHGGMCVSYSGRCTLSNYTVLRDANRGGCAHTCRWLYNLYEGDSLVSDDYDFQMSSKDLEATNQIKDLLDLKVASLKVEGRMKSIHYIATVINTYRMMIDDYEMNCMRPIEQYQSEIKKAENRLTSHGFFEGETTIEQQLYNSRSEVPTKEFVGLVKAYDYENKELVIQQRNYFEPKDRLEILMPDKTIIQLQAGIIRDEEDLELDAARHPLQIVRIACPIAVMDNSMIRKII